MKTDRKNKNRGALLNALQSAKPGETVYTSHVPRYITAIASMYGLKLKTEIVLSLEGLRSKDQKVIRLTKITVL